MTRPSRKAATTASVKLALLAAGPERNRHPAKPPHAPTAPTAPTAPPAPPAPPAPEVVHAPVEAQPDPPADPAPPAQALRQPVVLHPPGRQKNPVRPTPAPKPAPQPVEVHKMTIQQLKEYMRDNNVQVDGSLKRDLKRKVLEHKTKPLRVKKQARLLGAPDV